MMSLLELPEVEVGNMILFLELPEVEVVYMILFLELSEVKVGKGDVSGVTRGS